MAPLGKFCEIGKSDIFKNTNLGMSVLKQNITFLSCQLDLLADSHPQLVHDLLVECTEKLASGELRLIETQIVPFSDAPEVFRKMSKGMHEGKLVMKVGGERASLPKEIAPCKSVFFSDATYLFTGATRGIGLAVASWAILQGGARHVVLLGSSFASSKSTDLAIQHLRREVVGLDIRVERVNLTDETEMRALLESCKPAVRGVFHFATSYVAGKSDSISAAQLEEGFAVKARAAKILDSVTRSMKLDTFFMASSLAGVFGNSYQAIYAAANTTLHGIAAERARLGLAALALDLPLMLGAGHLADFANILELEINTRKGFVPVSVNDLCQVISILLLDPQRYPPHVSLDRPKWKSIFEMTKYGRVIEHNLQKVVHLSAPHVVQEKRSKSVVVAPARIKSVVKKRVELDSAVAPDTFLKMVVEKVSFLLGCSASDIDHSVPLTSLGFDSLAAVELSNWIVSDFGITSIGQTKILNGLSVKDIVAEMVKSGTSVVQQREEVDQVMDDQIAEVEEEAVSSDEVEEEVHQNEEAAEDESTALTVSVRPKNVEAAVKEKMSFLLGCAANDLDLRAPLTDLGVDSLAAMELANWATSEFGVNLSQTSFLNGMTSAELIVALSQSEPSVRPAENKEAKKFEKKAKKVETKKPKIDLPVLEKKAEKQEGAAEKVIGPKNPVLLRTSAAVAVRQENNVVFVDILASAFTPSGLSEIISAICLAEASKNILALVVTSACTGMDLSGL